MEKCKKWLENLWYHYKVQLLVALGLLVAVALSWDSLMPETEPEPAFKLAVISSQQYRDEELAALKEALAAQYGSAAVSTYRVALGELNQDRVEITRLDTDLAYGGLSNFFLEDVQAFEDATNGLEISEAVQVKNIPELAGLGFDELWYVTRR